MPRAMDGPWQVAVDDWTFPEGTCRGDLNNVGSPIVQGRCIRWAGWGRSGRQCPPVRRRATVHLRFHWQPSPALHLHTCRNRRYLGILASQASLSEDFLVATATCMSSTLDAAIGTRMTRQTPRDVRPYQTPSKRALEEAVGLERRHSTDSWSRTRERQGGGIGPQRDGALGRELRENGHDT